MKIKAKEDHEQIKQIIAEMDTTKQNFEDIQKSTQESISKRRQNIFMRKQGADFQFKEFSFMQKRKEEFGR